VSSSTSASSGRDDSLITTVGCLLTAVTLGWALQRSNGTLDAVALNRLTATLVFAAVAVLAPRVARSERPLALALPPFLVLALGFQFAQFLLKAPAGFLQLDEEGMTTFHQLLALAAVTAGACVGERSWLRHVFLAVLLWSHLKLGSWVLAHTQDPFIDVHVFQRDSLAALLNGRNPYAIDFPNLYGDGTPFYGPGLTAGGRVLFGYIYPPINLLLALPGHVLAGDHRYSHLVAMTLTGALLAYARPGILGNVCAAIYLFTPRSFYVLERGWTEPFVVLLLAATVFCACQLPRALPYLFGLFISAKQYLFLVVPLYALLLPRPLPPLGRIAGLALRAAAIPVALTAAFALWNPRGFYHSVVELQFHQPFRKDALSYSAWMVKQGGEALPVWVGFALAVVMVVLVLWRAPRTPAGLAAGVGLTMVAFFSVNKQAFCNYYYLVLGAFACGAAVSFPLEVRAPAASPFRAPAPEPEPAAVVPPAPMAAAVATEPESTASEPAASATPDRPAASWSPSGS
jgi:hypothetical protein